MEPERVRQLAEQFMEHLVRLENGDATRVESLADMFAEHAELVNPAIQHRSPPLQGRENIRKFWQGYREGFREIHTDFAEVTANDHAAGLFWVSKGVNRDNESIAYDGVSLLVFDDAGKIVKFHGYYDSRQLTGGGKPVGDVGYTGYG